MTINNKKNKSRFDKVDKLILKTLYAEYAKIYLNLA